MTELRYWTLGRLYATFVETRRVCRRRMSALERLRATWDNLPEWYKEER